MGLPVRTLYKVMQPGWPEDEVVEETYDEQRARIVANRERVYWIRESKHHSLPEIIGYYRGMLIAQRSLASVTPGIGYHTWEKHKHRIEVLKHRRRVAKHIKRIETVIEKMIG